MPLPFLFPPSYQKLAQSPAGGDDLAQSRRKLLQEQEHILCFGNTSLEELVGRKLVLFARMDYIPDTVANE